MTEQSKTRAKKFSDDEIMNMVDIIEENKSKIFGALSSTLTADDKNKIWEEIAGQISERHGNTRTRDEISKKWYNTLSKYKPRIADKIASCRKTGGGPPEECLDELEGKIFSIKGKEAFEVIESGIDVSLERSSNVGDNGSMFISPTPSQEPEKFFKYPSLQRKRKFSDGDTSGYEEIKQSLLNSEEEKLQFLKNIDSKLDRVVTLFERVAEDQSKIVSWIINSQTTQYPFLPPFSSNFHPTPPFYPPQDECHK